VRRGLLAPGVFVVAGADYGGRPLLQTLEFSTDRSRSAAAREDILNGFASWRFWTMLGWNDIRQRYRRSMLGPLWITLSMAIMIGALAVIYGAIFNMPLADYLPYLAAGLMSWLFVSSTINEGATAFTMAEGIIKQSSIPLSIYVYRVVWRNVIVLAHNSVVLAIIFVLMQPVGSIRPLALLAGLALVLANLFAVSVVLATLSTRFRDLPPIVASLTQVMFYITPILYKPSQLPGRMELIAHYNPLFHLIDVLRRPLTGELADPLSYIVSVATLIVVGGTGFILFRRFRGRVAYWL
jgi:ABC-type polysaccharide/polyol phosphate export permease